MLKNALEAVRPGQSVYLEGVCHGDGRWGIVVKNPGVIPRDVLLQLFKRSYSTKGNNRGLGTYSMRLLGEQYLQGHITVQSDLHHDTVFSFWFPREPKTRLSS
jgi:sensor histidine kinase regulating citrate/malate metabolism